MQKYLTENVMPIELFHDNDELKVRQTFNSPTIYFDHWAICEFSDHEDLQNRFVKINYCTGISK